jgi:hypothetical protein
VVALANLSTAVVEQLRPIAPPEQSTPFLKKPGTWIVAGGVVAALVGGFFLYEATRPQNNGSVTVTSP